ncbi:DUF3011 domain-containing protein [Lysobacter silvisoli]|uniref:DUF3011 domain-containing protein n=1 Tax=Lysobacter silvisoli TaxID=2293254 RepID=A0A371K3S6_9GAMM|nr:DUF3011 domain-containing protein [Lysobacter silvisoli]RDZ28579.1 DUF3011 domain-containing protein [Lysobacter silvisoli]
MKRIVSSILILGLVAPLAGPAHAAGQTVRCESGNGQYQSCPVDTRGGVTLSRQLSSSGCWQNDTWGYDRNRIWVTNGCRAEFYVGEGQSSGRDNSGAIAGAVVVGLLGAAILANKNKKDRDRDRYYDDGPYYGGNGYQPNNVVRCESTDNRYVRCPYYGRGHVEVQRQLSKTYCQYGQNWGVERNSIWVDNGCRADFGVY